MQLKVEPLRNFPLNCIGGKPLVRADWNSIFRAEVQGLRAN